MFYSKTKRRIKHTYVFYIRSQIERLECLLKYHELAIKTQTDTKVRWFAETQVNRIVNTFKPSGLTWARYYMNQGNSDASNTDGDSCQRVRRPYFKWLREDQLFYFLIKNTPFINKNNIR